MGIRRSTNSHELTRMKQEVRWTAWCGAT